MINLKKQSSQGRVKKQAKFIKIDTQLFPTHAMETYELLVLRIMRTKTVKLWYVYIELYNMEYFEYIIKMLYVEQY